MESVNSGDTAFVLLSAALVCLMTPGLAFFYGGLVRRKNVLAIMMQSFISMGIVTAIWVLFGYSMAFAKSHFGFVGGLDHWGLKGVGTAPAGIPAYGSTIPFLAHFGYQEMFAVITPALITGAFADRVTFKAYLIFLVFWSVLVYVPFVHWIWNPGGFLAKQGVVDFAGGAVVHISAGFAALASVFVVGKRKLKPGEATAPHNVGYVALGTGLLWFGWFGFNGGSALAANGVAATAVVNTDIAGSIAMVTWLLLSWKREGKPSMVGALTGAVAGLACITPAAGYVRPWAAAVIGLAAGVVCYGAVVFRQSRKWDDALDVWGCHGVGGLLGVILTGVFAASRVNGTSGLIEGNTHQFVWQCAAAGITAVYTFVVTFLLLKAINAFTPVRVADDVEDQGLDETIHGEKAYDLGA